METTPQRKAPLRCSVAAMAIIRRRDGGQTLWLAQWNRHWKAFNFVGGHKRADESFLECVTREVSEELGLVAAADFVVTETPLAQVSYVALSQSVQEDTQYTMELFDVSLTGAEARRVVEGNPHNCWLTEGEISSGRCADGQPISETMALLLDEADLSGRGSVGKG